MIINRTLNNGIRMVMEASCCQSVSVGIWVKPVPLTRAGPLEISHLIEHMMFKGTKKRSAKQIAEDVDRIGGHMNAFTGRSRIITSRRSKIVSTKHCDILIDMFLNSKFDPEELLKEKM